MHTQAQTDSVNHKIRGSTHDLCSCSKWGSSEFIESYRKGAEVCVCHDSLLFDKHPKHDTFILPVGVIHTAERKPFIVPLMPLSVRM